MNNRSEEAAGSAKNIWIAYREGRFEKSPAPFWGYFFLLEDRPSVHTPVSNKEPHFPVDPEFKGRARSTKLARESHEGVSHAKRYELLCRRLVMERLHNAACFAMATNTSTIQIRQPAEDLTFLRMAAALRGRALTFLVSQTMK